MHLTRNQAYLHGYRGFKSLSLRQALYVSREAYWTVFFAAGLCRTCSGLSSANESATLNGN
jgi:hypothetical protein